MIRPWFRQAAVPWKTTAHPDKSIWGESSLHQTRGAPGEVPGLHAAAAGWLADRGFAVEAIRHAQAAGDWEMAVRLLAGHWPGLLLDGQAGTAHELLAGFPARGAAADAELARAAARGRSAAGSPAAPAPDLARAH